MTCFQEAGVGRYNVDESQVDEADSNENGDETTTLYTWGGSLHLVPEDFEFPHVTVSDAWQMWVVVDSRKGYPPLRKLSPSDFLTRNNRKRFSDLKYLMKKIEEEARRIRVSCQNMTPAKAVQVFKKCSKAV
jgi:hypothetical protein